MLTADQISANRKTLSNLLRSQMSLPDNASDWTYSQRVDYNKAFAAYVLAHPDSFGTQDETTAQVITQEQPQDLSDTSLSANIEAFGSAVLDNVTAAGADVAGIGQGVLNTASLAKYLIPVAAVVALGILLLGLKKRVAR